MGGRIHVFSAEPLAEMEGRPLLVGGSRRVQGWRLAGYVPSCMWLSILYDCEIRWEVKWKQMQRCHVIDG